MPLIKFCHVLDSSDADRMLYNTIKYSDLDNFEFTVITLAPAGDLHEQMKELGVESFSLNHTSRRQSLSSFLKLFQYFRKNKTQVVQAHLMDSSIIGISAAKVAGVAVRICSGHHSAENALTDRKLLKFVDGFSPRFAANHTIAPSERMKQIFINDFGVPKDKVTVIHHGLDLEILRASAEHSSNIREELDLDSKTVFLAAGRINWVKDFATLIDGFADAVADRDDVVLLIAGGGEQSALKQKIDEKKVTGKVFVLGRRNDLAAVMKDCDIFIHSSLTESFGMVYIEAFALGKPIICTPTGIAVDIVADGVNGYFFEPGNSSDLSEVIKKALNSKQKWVEMGANGKHISENFAIQKTQAMFNDFVSKWIKNIN